MRKTAQTNAKERKSKSAKESKRTPQATRFEPTGFVNSRGHCQKRFTLNSLGPPECFWRVHSVLSPLKFALKLWKTLEKPSNRSRICFHPCSRFWATASQNDRFTVPLRHPQEVIGIGFSNESHLLLLGAASSRLVMFFLPPLYCQRSLAFWRRVAHCSATRVSVASTPLCIAIHFCLCLLAFARSAERGCF